MKAMLVGDYRHRRWALLVCLVLTVWGCSGDKAQRQPLQIGKAVSQVKFAKGSRLDFRLEFKGENIANGATIKTEQQIDYSLQGGKSGVDIYLREVKAILKQGARELVHLDVSRNTVRGHVQGKSLALVAKSSDKELSAFARKLTSAPYARVGLDDNAQVTERKRLAPLEADVLISTAAIDYVSFLLAPLELKRQSWSRRAHWPIQAGVTAVGQVDYTVAEKDWQERDRRWFYNVKIDAIFSADGKQTAETVTNFPDAKAGRVLKADMQFKGSAYRVTGQLLYSRQVGQFVSGQLTLSGKHEATGGGQTFVASTNVTFKLQMTNVSPALPIPRSSELLQVSQSRPQVDQKRQPLMKSGRNSGMGWDLQLDLRFRKGVVAALANESESEVYVLSPEGRLICVETAKLVRSRMVELGPCLALGWCREKLAVLRKEPRELLLLEPQTFQVEEAWKVPGADSMSASRGSSWVTLGRLKADYLTVVDTAKGEAIYHIDGRDLSRIQPRMHGRHRIRRQRPARLAQGGVVTSGEHFVALGSGFHRLDIVNGELVYAEDSTEINSDGSLLLFSEAGNLIAVRSSGGHRKIGRSGIPDRPGVYVYSVEKPEQVVGVVSESYQTGGIVDRFFGEQLVMKGQSNSRISKKFSAHFSGQRFAPVVHTGWARRELGERMAVLPLKNESAFFFGRDGAIWSVLGRAAPLAMKQGVTGSLEVIENRVAAVDPIAATKLESYSLTKMPGKIHIESQRPQVATSLDGRFIYALLTDHKTIIEIDVASKQITRQVEFAAPKKGVHRIRYLNLCGNRLIASDNNGRDNYIFDASTLKCLGKILQRVGGPNAAAGSKPMWLSADANNRFFFLYDLSTLAYRQIFPEHIAGLEERVSRKRDDRIRFLQLNDDGSRLAMVLGDKLLVVSLQGSPRVIHRHSIPATHRAVRRITYGTIGCADPNHNNGLLFWDWTAEKPARKSITFPAGFVLCRLQVSGELFLAKSRHRQVHAFDVNGKLINDYPVVLEPGTATSDRVVIYASPQAGELALYDSVKQLIYWVKAKSPTAASE